MAKLKITQSPSGADLNVTYPQAYPAEQVDRYVSPTLVSGAHIGGTGGLTSQTGLQIQPSVYVNATGASQANGSILAQKGAHKFRVTDGTYTGDCKLVNNPTLSAGQMSVQINLSNITSVTLASSNVAGGATSATISWTATNLTGPVATPRVGDYISGITGQGNVSATAALVTSVVSSTSVTVAASGNVASATGLSVTDYTYASRITNKFVYDFTSDGYPDSTSGIVTYYTSGYNPTKYKYRLAAPNNVYVQVASA